MGSYGPNTSRRVPKILFCFFLLGSLCLAVAASSFFQRFSCFFYQFSDNVFWDVYFLRSFLYFKELAKNYNIFCSRLVAAPLSAETRRLSTEMKIPSAEVDTAQAPSEGDICLRSIVMGSPRSPWDPWGNHNQGSKSDEADLWATYRLLMADLW